MKLERDRMAAKMKAWEELRREELAREIADKLVPPVADILMESHDHTRQHIEFMQMRFEASLPVPLASDVIITMQTP